MTNPFSVAAQFLRRSRTERKLLLAVSRLFITAHWLVRRRSLEQARAALQGRATSLSARAADAQQLAWAVDRVNAYLPGHHSCLINALCGDAVAHASGIDAVFRVGAAHNEAQHRFHAWVESEGAVLTGGEHEGFVPMA